MDCALDTVFLIELNSVFVQNLREFDLVIHTFFLRCFLQPA